MQAVLSATSHRDCTQPTLVKCCLYKKSPESDDAGDFFVLLSRNYFTRSPYERSVVLTRILSPMLMKRGAMMMAPVSRVTSC